MSTYASTTSSPDLSVAPLHPHPMVAHLEVDIIVMVQRRFAALQALFESIEDLLA